jgi:RNA polymerase sigma factor (sigma-70 family)
MASSTVTSSENLAVRTTTTERKSSAQQLFRSNIGIAKSLALKYCRTRPHLNLDDLIQECLIVLYKSALNHAPGKGHFGRYAKVSIEYHLRGFWKGNVDQQRQISLDAEVGISDEGDPITRADRYEEREGRRDANSRPARGNEINRIVETREFILQADALTPLERRVLKLHVIDELVLSEVADRLKRSVREVQIARVEGVKKLREHFSARGFKVSTGKIQTDQSDMYSDEDVHDRAVFKNHPGHHKRKGIVNPQCRFCRSRR